MHDACSSLTESACTRVRTLIERERWQELVSSRVGALMGSGNFSAGPPHDGREAPGFWVHVGGSRPEGGSRLHASAALSSLGGWGDDEGRNRVRLRRSPPSRWLRLRLANAPETGSPVRCWPHWLVQRPGLPRAPLRLQATADVGALVSVERMSTANPRWVSVQDLAVVRLVQA